MANTETQQPETITLAQALARAGWIGTPHRFPQQAIATRLLDAFAEMYTTVADGEAIPFPVEYLEPGMRVVSAVRCGDRTVGTSRTTRPQPSHPATWFTRITWEPEESGDSIGADGRTFAPDHYVMVRIDSLPW